VKPFVPLVHSQGHGAWRGLAVGGKTEEALPVDAEELLLSQVRRGATPEPEPPPAPPEPDPELVARIEELEAALEQSAAELEARDAEHAAAMETIAAQRKDLAQAVERVAQVARSVDAARTALVEELREGIGSVILEAARRMAGEALHADPRLIEAMVEEASRALGREGLRVRVAPQDAAHLRAALEGQGIVVVPDPRVDAGAICEGPSGRIDASLESATSAIASVLSQWRAAP
jgi:flagellar biosynthesis/type III secretory pathway protein FliH